VASYFAIKNNMSTDNTGDVKTTVTPTVSAVSLLRSDVVSLDNTSDVPTTTEFNADSQAVGKEPGSAFAIGNIAGTKYTTFTEIDFEGVDASGENSTTVVPAVTATYDPVAMTITVNFKNTTASSALIKVGEEYLVGTDTISTVARVTPEDSADATFVIDLNANTTYALYLPTRDTTVVALAIKETTTTTTTTTPTITSAVTTVVPTTTAITPTAKVTTTPITGSNLLENSFSQAAQTLNNGLTTNTANMICQDKCLYWIESGKVFTFDKPVSLGDNGKYPTVNASLSGSVLTVTINNLVNKTASSSMTFSGSDLVKSLDAVRSGNTLTYTFTLYGAQDYRILYTDSANIDGAKVLRVQVQ
jgi:hypothetical protein